MIPIAKPIIPSETIDYIKSVLDSGMLACGDTVRKFTDRFLELSNIPHGVSCNSGTAALHVALEALGIQEGDEVITAPFTFIASSNAILFQGAKPVFVDIDERTFTIDSEKIEEKITEKTKAILVVHLFGLPVDMKRVLEIAREYNLYVIEDCAQAHLSSIDYNGEEKVVGSMGDIGAYSFYPTKNMTTSEGGAIVSHNEELIKKAHVFVDQGQSSKYYHTHLGYNYRLTNLAAAIGLVQLKYIEGWTEQRIKNAGSLTSFLSPVSWLETPYVPEGYKHVFHQYVMKVKDNAPKSRDEIMGYLREKGVGTAIHYPDVIYNQPLYKDRGFRGDCPIAERVAKQVFSLPVHPAVTEDEIGYICEVMRGIES